MTKVETAGISDIGLVRGRNEDCLGHCIPEDPAVATRKGHVFIVADGVGGYGAGDVASQTAVEDILTQYYASPRAPLKALKNAVAHANLRIFDLAVETNHNRMQTTLSALAIVGNMFHVAHVGDTRVYRARPNTEIEQLTTDHSEVAELVRLEILSPDKVRGHDRRSIITRSVGAETVVRPAVRSGSVRAGDYFVMLTDGAWEPIEDAEIREIAVSNEPKSACERIVKLGMERNSRDNLSAQIVHVVEVDEHIVPVQSTFSAVLEQMRRFFRHDEVL